MAHRRDIEGLRALAVLAVLLYHLGVPGFDGGFVGVDVFFVISGFLITSLLLDEREGSGRVSIRRFYARRARRLLPISATVIVVTVIAGAVWLPATRLELLAEDARAAALFAANLLFADRGTNYLTAGLDPSPLRHYWSLAVEEQFYFVWPALIGLLTLGARNIRRRTSWAMGMIVVGSFALSTLFTADQPSWSYFGPHTRAWELGVGALLACLAPTVQRIPTRVLAPIGWAGMMGMAVCIGTYGNVTTQFPGWVAAVPVLATAAVLAAGDDTPEAPGLLLGLGVLQYVGSRSYSLYLWHWPVIIIAEGHYLRELTLNEKLIAVAATIVLAEAGYRLIENPIRRSRPLTARPVVSLAFGAALVATSVLAAAVLADYDPTERTGVVAAAPDLTTPATSISTTSTEVATTPPTTPPAPITMQNLPAQDFIIQAMATTVKPDNLRPSLRSANADVPVIYSNGCHIYGARSVHDGCDFGDPSSSLTIALWGDSHAAQWFVPLEQMATAHGWRLLSLTQGTCTVLDITTYDQKNDREFANCTPWRESVRQYLRSQSVDVVILSSHWNLLSADTHQAIGAQEWTNRLPQLLDSLRADGIEPIVFGDSPNPDTTVPDCIAENARHTDRCAAEQYGRSERQVAEAIRAVTTAAGVGFVEPGEWLCTDEGLCPPIVGDILVYRDGNHLTNTVAAWLTPLVEQTVGPFIEQWQEWLRSQA